MYRNRLVWIVAVMASSIAIVCFVAKYAPKDERLSPITNSIGMKFVYISPGEFTMGSPVDTRHFTEQIYLKARALLGGPKYVPLPEDAIHVDETEHRVRITKGFYIGATEVTQKQWKAVKGTDPFVFKGDVLPVENVTWSQALDFCKWLSAKDGKKYRLPTEAEWEYACRAGTTTKYNTGNDLEALNRAGWYLDNSGGRSHPVGQKQPNAWGLFDMHGNVTEWCADWYGPYPSPKETSIDPKGPLKGEFRVLRGSGWCILPNGCRSAFRVQYPDYSNAAFVGFRVVLDVNVIGDAVRK